MPNNTFWLNLTFSQEILSWHEHGRGAPFHVSNGTYNDAVDGDWRHYQYVYGIHDVQHLRAQDQAAWRVIQVRDVSITHNYPPGKFLLYTNRKAQIHVPAGTRRDFSSAGRTRSCASCR